VKVFVLVLVLFVFLCCFSSSYCLCLFSFSYSDGVPSSLKGGILRKMHHSDLTRTMQTYGHIRILAVSFLWLGDANLQKIRHSELTRTMRKHTEINVFWLCSPHAWKARICGKCTILSSHEQSTNFRKSLYSGCAPSSLEGASSREVHHSELFRTMCKHTEIYVFWKCPSLLESAN
jgi:hypothetical protein